MKRRTSLFLFLLVMLGTFAFTGCSTTVTPEKIVFKATDGVEVTADLYLTKDEKAPFIILYHQATYSRGEYGEIAPKLVKQGYNCLAVDQRSGSLFNGVKNETLHSAIALKLPTDYQDAYPDMEAALTYISDTYKPETLLIWGSSYSSSLSFALASEHKDLIDGMLAFSPSDNFTFKDQAITAYASQIKCPVFISSSKYEEGTWKAIKASISAPNAVFFIPQESGVHGSSALLEATPNHLEYWEAVNAFLKAQTAQ